MLKVNLYEAKAKLGRYVKRAQRGEVIIICERNQPVAELRRLSEPTEAKRLRLGVLVGLEVPDDFDAPLPDFERDFYGNGG